MVKVYGLWLANPVLKVRSSRMVQSCIVYPARPDLWITICHCILLLIWGNNCRPWGALIGSYSSLALLLKHIFFFFFFFSTTALAMLITDAHTVFSNSTSSIHLNLSLSVLLPLPGLPSSNLTFLSLSVPTVYPSHSNLCTLFLSLP